MNTISSRIVTITQNGVEYKKIAVSDFEKGQLSLLCHKGRANHAVWDKPNVKWLSETQCAIRTAAKRGDALIVGNDYFVR